MCGVQCERAGPMKPGTGDSLVPLDLRINHCRGSCWLLSPDKSACIAQERLSDSVVLILCIPPHALSCMRLQAGFSSPHGGTESSEGAHSVAAAQNIPAGENWKIRHCLQSLPRWQCILETVILHYIFS